MKEGSTPTSTEAPEATEATEPATKRPRRHPSGPFERMDSDSDETLIERWRAHEDDGAFTELVHLHQRDAYRLAYRIAGNHEDAHDLAQEAFVRVHRGLKSFRGESSFKTWLYRIVVNLSLNHVRKMRKERDGHVDIDGVALPVAPRALQAVLQEETRVRLEGAIEKLPEKQKKTLILKVFHELKYVEIAAVMSCSVGTAKANFFHAVQSLKREMGGLG
jgi:RNA polymerase sigma-70 factor (ECF subfamily)